MKLFFLSLLMLGIPRLASAACSYKDQNFFPRFQNQNCPADYYPTEVIGEDGKTALYCQCKDPGSAETQSSNAAKDPSVEQMGQACLKDTESAKENCDFNSNPSVKMVMAMVSGLKMQMNQSAMTNQAALCSQMGSLAQSIDGAVGAYSAYCSSGYMSCGQSCDSDMTELKDRRKQAEAAGQAGLVTQLDERIKVVRDAQKECGALAQNVTEARDNILSYAQMEQMKSQTCGQQVNNIDEMCKANPSLPMCPQNLNDCSNPQAAATNTVCICAKNPMDPRCGAGSGAYTGYVPGSVKPTGSSGSGTDGLKGDFGTTGGGFGDSAGFVDPSKNGKNDSGGSQNNKGGGRANVELTGDGQNGGGRAAGGGGGSGTNTKIIGGYGFGSGGSTGSYSSGRSGSGQGGYNGYQPRAQGKNVDLRQFMPGGGMDPRRALAGISGPDGITGPNTDIWKKINIRYLSVSTTLLP